MQCYTCFGSGHITCPACNGKGSYWKVVGRQNVFEPCYQCGGRRTVNCQTCHGTGTLADVMPPIAPPPVPPTAAPDPALEHLEGRWKGFGSRFEFVHQDGGYQVTQFNLLGMKIAEGEAGASGNVLTLTVRNKLTGSMTVDLQSSGDRLTGTVRGLIPLPFDLRRAS